MFHCYVVYKAITSAQNVISYHKELLTALAGETTAASMTIVRVHKVWIHLLTWSSSVSMSQKRLTIVN